MLWQCIIMSTRKERYIFFANELFVYLLGAFDDMMAPVVWDKEKQNTYSNKKNH